MANTKEKFQKLVDAIKRSDNDTINSLRADWEEIQQYVLQTPIEINLGEKQPALILWLSTRPAEELVDWSNVIGVPPFVMDERQSQVELVDTLWDSWLTSNEKKPSNIIAQLSSRFEMVTYEINQRWLRNAQQWFPSFAERLAEKRQLTEGSQTRLDIVSGYGAFIDQLLIDQGGFAEAYVLVDGLQQPPGLKLPNHASVKMESVAESIYFRSGLDLDTAQDFAVAISYSLPAHPQVLPTISVEVDGQCKLKSTWKDNPLAHRESGNRGYGGSKEARVLLEGWKGQSSRFDEADQMEKIGFRKG